MKKITFLSAFFFAMYGFAQFPKPYCGPLSNPGGNEPITLVNFAGINNTSSNALTENAHEDFTLISGNVLAGSTYTIKLKGNTDGTNNTNIAVYIDWNQNFVLDDAGESYNVGSIVNSTGLDAVELIGQIVVPATALVGNTRMRVVKRYTTSTNFPPPCLTNVGFGQTEDYTVSVAIPTCIAPAAGTTIVNSPSQATLSWASPITNFEVLVQLASLPAPAIAAPDGTGINVAGNTYVANSLISNTAYSYFVRSECVTGLEFSTWSGPFNFLTKPNCVALTVVNVPTAITSTSATISWVAPTIVPAQYEINYGISPYILNSAGGLTVTSNTNSIELSSLIVGATYNYFIRSKCSAVDFGLYTASQLLSLPNANGEVAIYNTTKVGNEGVELTTTANGPATQVGDAIRLGGTARILKSITASLVSTSVVTPYVVTMSLYTDCPSVTGAGVCGSGTGFLFPFSDPVSVNVTPTAINVIQDVVFNFNNIDLSSETDGTITVMINSSSDNVSWILGETPTIGSMPVGETGNGYFSRCGSIGANNGCARDFFTPNNVRMKIIAATAPLVKDTFTSLNFKSFPNPVNDILNLSYDKNITNVSIINLLGQEVLSAQLNSQEAKIDVSKLNIGIYNVKITADNEVKTIKVIKE